jgi:D-alanyl-D-alanine endopeptidase (penicillin-binding protein 7)
MALMFKQLLAAVMCTATFTAGAWGFSLQSPRAVVLDRDTGATLYAKNAQDSAPAASITKLVTSMVVLDGKPNMDEVLTVTDADVDMLKHSRSRLRVGASLPRREMLHLALMSSENRAAHALARYAENGDMDKFVRLMNAKAQSLGMTSARFVDPTGLSPSNTASASDLAKLVEGASHYPIIGEITSRTGETVDVGGTELLYKNSNHLVGHHGWDVLLSKTGYIEEAGRCVVMNFRAAGRNLVVVLMGADSEQERARDLLKARSWVTGEPMEAVARVRKTGARGSRNHVILIQHSFRKKKQGTRGVL